MQPFRGEVWSIDLDPVRGHEQGRLRPALVVSNNLTNASPSGMVTVVPITTKSRPVQSKANIYRHASPLARLNYGISPSLHISPVVCHISRELKLRGRDNSCLCIAAAQL